MNPSATTTMIYCNNISIYKTQQVTESIASTLATTIPVTTITTTTTLSGIINEATTTKGPVIDGRYTQLCCHLCAFSILSKLGTQIPTYNLHR